MLDEDTVLGLLARVDSPRDNRLIHLLYATGGCVSEIYGRTWKDVQDSSAIGAAELASIAITVLIMDRLVEWRAERREKKSLIL